MKSGKLDLFSSPEADMMPYHRERAREIKSLPAELQKTLVWLYTYPVIDGTVQNTPVQEFISGVLHLKKIGKLAAYNDFHNRGYTINNLNIECEESGIENHLRSFIETANAYNSGEKEKIIAFIASRGGQDLNYLVQKIIQFDHFVPPQYKGLASSNGRMITADWSIGEDGYASFEWVSDLLSIEARHMEKSRDYFLVRNKAGELHELDPTNSDGFDLVSSIDKPGSIPILRIKYKIRLAIIDGIVVPQVANIAAFNFTKNIETPELRLINQNDGRQLHLYRCLQHVNKSMHKYPAKQAEYQALETVGRLINQSNNGENPDEIRFAIQFIESIRLTASLRDTKKIFGKVTREISAGNLFEQDEKFIEQYRNITGNQGFTRLLRSENDEQRLIKRLLQLGVGMSSRLDCIKYQDIKYALGSIYLSLCKYNLLYDPIYTVDFNRTKNEITGLFVIAWQERMKHAVRRKTDQNSEEHINSRVDMFMCDSNYGSTERDETIKKWLVDKPMESINSLLVYMFEHHLFTINLPGIDSNYAITPCNHKTTDTRWFIDAQGRVNLSLTNDIYALEARNYEKNTSYEFTRDKQSKHLTAGKNSNLSPIARISIRICLELSEDMEITPTVRAVHVVGYTPDFSLSPSAINDYAMKEKNTKVDLK